MNSQTSTHHPNYIKIWAILVGLLALSVAASFVGIRWLTLTAAFGIALVKARLVAQNFMHLDTEKPWVDCLMGACLLFMVLLFAGVYPDVTRHRGLQWVNNSAIQSVESGSHNAAARHE